MYGLIKVYTECAAWATAKQQLLKKLKERRENVSFLAALIRGLSLKPNEA